MQHVNPTNPIKNTTTENRSKPVKLVEGFKLRGEAKVSRNPVKIPMTNMLQPKPEWIRIRLPHSSRVQQIKQVLRQHKLHTVCEEATCPNINECFSGGTATFMIMGDICTRRCPFCDVAHGRPKPLDTDEPINLAWAIKDMQLKYVVITSVDRDDLRDGGAQHFIDCIREVRQLNPHIKIEVLVPDFRGRMDRALSIFVHQLPDVFNHNLETVPDLYKKARPGADYQWSLDLLQQFKRNAPEILTKSGLMLGLGETLDQIREVMVHLKQHQVDMVTLGQYLQPSRHHLPVERYVTPDEFKELENFGYQLGFTHVASGPLVRSSYHADQQHNNGIQKTA